jgi:uncharacterized MAPEG superfamily protein
MKESLTLVVYMAVITWLMVLLASLVKARAWTPSGFLLALGNRQDLPEATGFAGRVERTAKNTLENFVFFAALVLVGNAAGAPETRIALGAEVFFWARIAYIPVYWLGIVYLRTAVWAVSIVGLVIIAATLL